MTLSISNGEKKQCPLSVEGYRIKLSSKDMEVSVCYPVEYLNDHYFFIKNEDGTIDIYAEE